jgi:hypothetical protein
MSWHQKMGHLNEDDLKRALRQETIKGLDFNPQSKLDACETCIKGKLTSKPFPTRNPPKSTERLEIIHSDVWGPFRVKSPGGASYFVTFTDERSRYTKIYFLKHKNGVLQCFKNYKNEVKIMTSQKDKWPILCSA